MGRQSLLPFALSHHRQSGRGDRVQYQGTNTAHHGHTAQGHEDKEKHPYLCDNQETSGHHTKRKRHDGAGRFGDNRHQGSALFRASWHTGIGDNSFEQKDRAALAGADSFDRIRSYASACCGGSLLQGNRNSQGVSHSCCVHCGGADTDFAADAAQGHG